MKVFHGKILRIAWYRRPLTLIGRSQHFHCCSFFSLLSDISLLTGLSLLSPDHKDRRDPLLRPTKPMESRISKPMSQ